MGYRMQMLDKQTNELIGKLHYKAEPNTLFRNDETGIFYDIVEVDGKNKTCYANKSMDIRTFSQYL